MDLAGEFRTRAQRCLKLAQEAPTIESHTHWIGMAQLWFNMAEYTESQDAEFLGPHVPPPPMIGSVEDEEGC